MAPVIERDVRNDIGGDEQRIDDMTTEYFKTTFKHLCRLFTRARTSSTAEFFRSWLTGARARFMATARTVRGRSRFL